MSERLRFILLSTLLIASLVLLWFANQAAGNVVFGGL